MKKNILPVILSLIWASTFVKAQVPFICQGQYYLSLSASVTSNSGLFLVDIDPISGNTVFNTIATSVGATMNAIGYRKTDNFIYGINPTSLYLYKVGSDGVAVDLGIPQGIIFDGNAYYAGDVTPDGNFLVLLGQSFNNPQGVIAYVDLNDPNFQVTSFYLTNSFTGIYDIAFDPFSGDLYGFSTGNSRLVNIYLGTNAGSVESNYPVQSQVNQVGALFFDVSGNLFGYGTISGQSTLVAINKATGVMTSVAQGPPSGGEDGCSCPYSIGLKKIVSTNTALPCTEVIYTFIITNGSGIIQTGLQLSDVMPENFNILEVISNPFGGTEVINGHFLDISGMTVPPGNNSIQVLVEIGEDALGLYQNQATLGGLPTSLGETTVSDNPATFVALDSTPIFIEPLDITFIEETYMICPGEPVEIDASLYGVSYLWEDGSEDPIRIFNEAGNYSVTVSSSCEQVIAAFEVTMEIISTYLDEQYFICEDIPLEIDVSTYGNNYLWEDGTENPVRIFTQIGDYAVTAYSGCDQTIINYKVLSNSFYVNILPDVVEIELGEFAILNATFWADNANVSFQWLDSLGNSLSCINCLSTISTPLYDVNYTLIMTVENGCIYEDQVLVKVKKDRGVYIPNVISPNFDGINDYFYVQSKRNNVRIKKMSIFDRWGNLVHEAENFDANQEGLGWDATFNGKPVQSSVFVYLVELEFLDGFVILEHGDVTVIR